MTFHHSRRDRWLQSFGYVFKVWRSQQSRYNPVIFQNGVSEFGTPVRVRSDKRLENYKVIEYIISVRGSGKGSMLTGKSCHNQTIERLWKDVYDGVIKYFYELFYYIEDEGLLHMLDPKDLYILHHCVQG